MEREYGIGRIPHDVDPAEEMLAEIEAEQLQPAPAPPRDRRYRACIVCGQGGYEGAYPFSTAPSTGCCDDCL